MLFAPAGSLLQAQGLQSGQRGTIELSGETTRIVVHEDNRSIGDRVADGIEQATGIRIPLLPDTEMNGKHWENHDLILIGNLNDNKAVERLYIHFQTFVDAAFPGEDGHVVKTGIDPFGTGRNTIVIAGSDPDGHARAAGRFLDLAGPHGQTLPPLHSIESALLPGEAPDSEEVERILEQNRSNWDMASGTRSIQNAIRYGLNYHFTDDPVWVRMFRETLLDYITRAEEAGDWEFAPRTGTYFRMMPVILSWDLIEYSPEISDSERRRIGRALLDITRYVAELPYLTDRGNPAGEPRQNHTTFATLSLDAAIRYFDKTGMADNEMADNEEIRKWRSITDQIFEGQLRTYRPDDDAGNYAWYGAQHAFGYLLRRDDARAFREGLMDKNADLAITVFDNRRDEVSFGDVRTYVPRSSQRWPRPATILSMAWWAHNDPAHAWAYQWLTEDLDPPLGFQMPLNTVLFAADMPEISSPPERFTGLHAIMLDDPLVEFIGSRVMNPLWIPRDGRPYFDKLSFRSSFEPRDEYMLLDGTSAFAHGHEDGNAILRLTWLDRLWLADLDIIRTMPRYHNTIEVAKDGATGVPPPMNELTVKSDLGNMAFARSDMNDYTGLNWSRNILWRKGESFIVIDRLEAQQAGEYDLRARWRVLGETDLDGRTLSVTQPGARFHISNADESLFEFEEEEPGQSDWSRYEHAAPVVTTWVQRRRETLAEGESLAFVNLLYARPDTEGTDLTLTRIEEGLALLKEAGQPARIAGIAPDRREFAGLTIEASAFDIGSDELHAAGLTYFNTPFSMISSDKPLDIQVSGGAGILRAGEETRLAVSGDWDIGGISGRTGHLPAGEHEIRLNDPLLSGDVSGALQGLALQPAVEREKWTSFGLSSGELGEAGGRVRVVDRMKGAGADGWLLGTDDGDILELTSGGDLGAFAGIEGTADAIAQIGEGNERVILTGGKSGLLTAFGPDGNILWTHQFGENR
ncbi:MAG: hypothetical protein WD317_08175, partial [Balneolaceae bacterium]